MYFLTNSATSYANRLKGQQRTGVMTVTTCGCYECTSCTAHTQTWFPLKLQYLPSMQITAPAPVMPQTHAYRDCHAAPSETLSKIAAVKQRQPALHRRTSMTNANKVLLGCVCSGHVYPAVHGLLLLLNPCGLTLTQPYIWMDLQQGFSRRMLGHGPAPSPPVSSAKEASLPCTLSKAAGFLALLLCISSSGSSSLSVLKASLGSVS